MDCHPETYEDAIDAITNAAVNRADEHADEEWKRRADEALRQIATALPILTPDDLWDVIERPREPRASGAVFRRAIKAGWIEPTGRLVKSRNHLQHGNKISEYRSLIYVHGIP